MTSQQNWLKHMHTPIHWWLLRLCLAALRFTKKNSISNSCHYSVAKVARHVDLLHTGTNVWSVLANIPSVLAPPEICNIRFLKRALKSNASLLKQELCVSWHFSLNTLTSKDKEMNSVTINEIPEKKSFNFPTCIFVSNLPRFDVDFFFENVSNCRHYDRTMMALEFSFRHLASTHTNVGKMARKVTF